MNIAVFTVMLPDLTPEQAATEMNAAGYNGVEWRVTTSTPDPNTPPSFWTNNHCTLNPTPQDAQRARTLSQNANLATPNIGTYINLNEHNKVQDAINFATTLGSPSFRVGFGTFEGNYTQHFNNARAFLQDIISETKPKNLKPLIEIHHRTITPSASLTHKLISHFTPDEIGVIHDAGNMMHEGHEDYRIGLELLGDYVTMVHLKNMQYEPQTKGVWPAKWAPMRNGVVNFTALFRALKERNYNGWFSVEDFSNALPGKDALKDNLAFIKETYEAA